MSQIDSTGEFYPTNRQNGQIVGFEFKWNNRKTRFPQNFLETYKAEGRIIDRNNFREFVKI